MNRAISLLVYSAGLWSFLIAVPAVAADPPPRYAVDAAWPKELPKKWIMGQVGGMAVDAQDHIWVLQRPETSDKDERAAEQNPPTSDCCITTPAVIEFDAHGSVLRSWGGKGFVPDWPSNEHGIWIDKAGDVWIGGNGVDDRQLLKFTPNGKQLMEIGRKSKAPKNNQDTSLLGRLAGIETDDAAHEVYIADGYLNNRIVVYDSQSGAFKRGWGAYGIPLSQIDNSVEQIEGEVQAAGAIPAYKSGDAPDKQFRSPVHCVRIANDGLVYVCDRHNDRIQVFTKQGKFVKEFFLKTATLGNGSTWAVTFSHDPAQKYLLVADGENDAVWTLDRHDGSIISSFGHKGRNAGQFYWLHQLVMDSNGNLYTGEVNNAKRVQKFVLQGQ